MHVPTMAEMMAKGESPEVLFWVGCAGSYDARAQKVSKAFAEIMFAAGVHFAILGDFQRAQNTRVTTNPRALSRLGSPIAPTTCSAPTAANTLTFSCSRPIASAMPGLRPSTRRA